MNISFYQSFLKFLLLFFCLVFFINPVEAKKRQARKPQKTDEQLQEAKKPESKIDKDFLNELLTVFSYKDISKVPQPSLWAVEKTIKRRIHRNDDELNLIKFYKEMMVFYKKEAKRKKRVKIYQYPESNKIFLLLKNALKKNFPKGWAPANL